jgi:hypothetical protein
MATKTTPSHVAPTPTVQKNTVVTKGVVVPDVTKPGSYAESISNTGGTVDFVDQYRAARN